MKNISIKILEATNQYGKLNKKMQLKLKQNWKKQDKSHTLLYQMVLLMIGQEIDSLLHIDALAVSAQMTHLPQDD